MCATSKVFLLCVVCVCVCVCGCVSGVGVCVCRVWVWVSIVCGGRSGNFNRFSYIYQSLTYEVLTIHHTSTIMRTDVDGFDHRDSAWD